MTDPDESYREILSDLSRSRAFSHLPKDRLAHIASLARVRQFRIGSVILKEGLPNRDLYFLMKGSVSVYSGGKFVCRYGRAGDMFGEMSVVSEVPVSATVLANEDVETVVIDGTIAGGFKSESEHEGVTVFYKLFSLSLLEKLKLTTLKAKLFEDAIRHAPIHLSGEADEFLDRTVAKQLADTLLTSQAVHTADQPIVVADEHGRVARINLAAENLFSLIELQVVGKPIQELCEDQSYRAIYPLLLEGEISSWSGELTFVKADGHNFPARTSLSVIQDQQGKQIGLLSIITDISSEKQLEEQLRQSQKMEAIGQLAGGMAHDFNNLLQIITTYTQFSLEKFDGDDPVAKDLNTVLNAARRGAHLTNRLLAFSRRKHLSLKIINLNDLLNDLVLMLRRLLGENIILNMLPGEELWNVNADSNLVEQVLTNLCINARDAMTIGGVLTVETRNVELDEEFCRSNYWARPGRYVMISVADNGAGIDPEHREHIFEPFFTTKDPGRGTGLGLSMALGIVQQHKGHLYLESEVGVGTTVYIYLPAIESESSAAIEEIRSRPTGGRETILVAEDEPDVRDSILRVLTNAGYNVFTASDGAEAERLFAEQENAIDLVLLDAIMPERNGKEVYEMIKMRKPELPAILISGYTPDTIGAEFIDSHQVPLIPKPFSPDRLLREVRKMLDSAHPPGSGSAGRPLRA